MNNQSNKLSKLDIRSKIILFICSTAAILYTDINVWSVFVLYAVVILMIIFFSKQPLLRYIKRTLTIYPMIFFITLPLIFTNQGKNIYPLFTLLGIEFFNYGLISFISVNIKSVLIILLTQSVLGASSLLQWINGFRQLRLPGWLVAILLLLQRFTTLIRIEFLRTVQAFQSRYIKLSFSQRLRAAGNITGTFIIRVLERSEQNYLSLDGRGFNSESFRNRQPHELPVWKLPDTMVVCFSIILLVTSWLVQ